ncbi:hypothetical protein OAQ99_03075 [Candidatus Kapabacteria bacterium]|nr:hypothetical protein [Candidatus Kapabacteria bacterium]
MSRYRKDKENGLGDHGVRKYDHLIGRFNSIDPLWEKYLGWSPYQYSANSPIIFFDIDGNIIEYVGFTPEQIFQYENFLDRLASTETGASIVSTMRDENVFIKLKEGTTTNSYGLTKTSFKTVNKDGTSKPIEFNHEITIDKDRIGSDEFLHLEAIIHEGEHVNEIESAEDREQTISRIVREINDPDLEYHDRQSEKNADEKAKQVIEELKEIEKK